MHSIPVGARGSFSLTVAPEHLASRFKDASLPAVLATPVMIMVMENAALNAIKPYLEDGETAVGTRVDVRHLTSTPAGRRVERAIQHRERPFLMAGGKLVLHVHDQLSKSLLVEFGFLQFRDKPLDFRRRWLRPTVPGHGRPLHASRFRNSRRVFGPRVRNVGSERSRYSSRSRATLSRGRCRLSTSSEIL